MAEKRVSVRLAAVGGRQVRAELEGIGEAGSRGFGRLSSEMELANTRLASFARRAGIALAAVRGADTIVRPILDAMQTMPTFVYMIPAVMLLGPGKVPAVLATVVYAVVPVIRLTSHGIRQVDQEVVEASRSFGSSSWQTLFKVQIPQALPTIMTGINQTMMMAVAMVVTCAMIGANGLGMEVLIAINRMESGRGIIAGFAIVIIAIIIDRLTQSLVQKEGK